MTIDTKGILTTTEKNPFKIWNVIKATLVKDMLETSGVNRQIDLWWNEHSGYTCPNAKMYDFAEAFDVTFMFQKEDRRLFVCLSCDSDYSEVCKGKKIILSLGAWGSSIHLMETVLKALQAEFGGRMFIIENDCADEWRELR